MTVRYKTARGLAVTVKWRDFAGVMHCEQRPMNDFEAFLYMRNWRARVNLPELFGV